MLTQHQDCPKPILEVADRRGIWSVGYHADASSMAGEKWITGGRWVWGPLVMKPVIEAMDGTYTTMLETTNYLVEGVIGTIPQ